MNSLLNRSTVRSIVRNKTDDDIHSTKNPSARGCPGHVAATLAAILLVVAFGCATDTGLTREQALEQVDAVGSLAAQLGSAKDDGLDMLAPRGVEAARESLEEAITSARTGQTIEAERNAQKGLARLERARADSRKSAETLREVLASRQRAVAAGAPTLLTDGFKELEDDLRDAAQRAESGDLEGAKKARPALLRGYSSLELNALKADATELARIAIEKARDAEADDYAPDTFGRAKKELSIAKGILETDRSRTEQANVHARRASEFATRSQFLSELVKEFDRRDYDLEAVLLWYQEQLVDLTSPLEPAISFERPNHEAIADARGRIAAAVQGRESAEEQLADARARIEALQLTSTASKADLESRLAYIEAAQRADQARYDRISSMFAEDEALVYRRGSDVLLTTYGFDFPVGESEIRSNNFGLLNKIARAISEFPSPRIVVSGHTDATGGDATNQKLSLDRAKKVGAFLVEVGRLDPNRVAIEGFGESKPVASNETDQGRARNRRIEILIVNRTDGALPAGAVSAPPPSR